MSKSGKMISTDPEILREKNMKLEHRKVHNQNKQKKYDDSNHLSLRYA
jgi:hypothetical protein